MARTSLRAGPISLELKKNNVKALLLYSKEPKKKSTTQHNIKGTNK